jgi:hypothetical protein
MAVTFLEVTRRGPAAWYLRWSSSLPSPVYRVLLDGQLYAETSQESMVVGVTPGEQVMFEVLDDPGAVPAVAYPGKALLQWERVEGAEKYRVEQWVGSAWVALRTVLDTGEAVLTHQTGWLADLTEHRFRVAPVGENAVDGTAREFAIAMVRKPDAPETATAYSAVTRRLTVSAA